MALELPPGLDDNTANTLLEIRPPALTCPKSAYEPTEPEISERHVVDYFLPGDVDEDDEDTDFSDLMVLDDFVVYRDDSSNPRDAGYVSFVGLNDVATKQGNTTFFFDGTVRGTDQEDKPKAFRLERISFTLVTISGYEDVDRHTVGDDLWIQSTHCRVRGDIWYRLGKPAPEYEQYNKVFTWIADLSKHLIDYLYMRPESSVYLADFEHQFAQWLLHHHGEDPAFLEWYRAYDRRDFRHALVSHSIFLQKHASDLDTAYLKHPLWNELGLPFGKAVIEDHPAMTKNTVVTPYVYECFRNMPWSSHLQVTDLSAQNKVRHQQRCSQMKFTGGKPKKPAVQPSHGMGFSVPGTSLKISPGDVIATQKDQVSVWKGGADMQDYWYALVQDIHTTKWRNRLYVIWLYHPTDTVCADLTYPYANELFLSDHCNCREARFDITQVVKKVPVTFSSRKPLNTTSGLFVRQTYHSVDETFTTLRKKDFLCQCRQPPPEPGYKPGDTVLVEGADGFELRLEPAEIVTVDGPKVEVRQLLRRKRDFGDPTARPNELVYTERFHSINVEQIHRRCHVRHYSEMDKRSGRIPPPYNRDGNGDAFYIVTRESSSGGLEDMDSSTIFNQGFDPGRPERQLRGLSIFSGGGNFDRGLEEGSAIQSEWAVEWCREQILTYLANHSHPDGLKLFCGSVNDYLKQAASGSNSCHIARLGEVAFISAGSPCQGYSPVNFQKQNEGSMRNSSMVASVAAYIDFYRPKYAILENVTSMASKQVKPSPFSQLLCAFVGMGYQLRILNLDAWSFGAPQSRSRLFVVIAAPGLELPEHPPLTHSHPRNNAKRRSLGEAPNGLPYGERHFDIPVFDYVSAAAGTQDLPPIDRGRVMRISEPDHRPVRIENAYNQNIINSIPKTPWTMGLQDALKRGWISADHADSTARRLEKQVACRSWSRVHPERLIGTVTTVASPSCRFTGRWLHWAEDRLISIKEARRAQGFPDSEVIIGKPAQQWKIIGNSVARQVALALGMSVWDACQKNAEVRKQTQLTAVTLLKDDISIPSGQEFEIMVPPETTRSPTSSRTGTETPLFEKAQNEQVTSNSSVSPEPSIASTGDTISRKRRIQVLDAVIIPISDSIPIASPAKQAKVVHES